MNEEIEIMKSAIQKNGKAMQTVVAIEEMSELQKELTKYIRGMGNRENLKEEVADVLIMITQIQLMYALPDDEVERIMRLKLNRLKERMEQNANVGKMSEKTDGDLISRQAVIDMLNKLIEVEQKQGTDVMNYGRERVNAYESILDEIESDYLFPPMPSAEKTTINPEKTTITDGDLISRQKEVKK